jgi:hypothetical protein
MSSSSLLPLLQMQLTRYGMITILVLGNMGNAFVTLLFSRHHKNACSMYLLYAAVMNNVFLLANVPLQDYVTYYGDPTVGSPIFCKLRYYLPNVWGQMARYFVVLACIDRFAATSINVRLRMLSRPSTARYLLGIITVFCHLVAIHLPIFVTIVNGRCGPTGPYYAVYTFYLLIFFNLIPPITMIIFGSLAYFNMKRLHARVRPVENVIVGNRNNVRIHRRDRELLSMLLSEIIIYIVATLLYPFILLEASITNLMSIEKSLQQIQIENFVLFIASFLVTLNHAAPFYIYLITSQAFRRDFNQLVNKSWRRIIRRPEVTMSQMTGRTPLQAETPL